MLNEAFDRKFYWCWSWTSFTLRIFFQDSCNVKVSSSVCKYNLSIASLESFQQRNLQDWQQYTFSLKTICNFNSEACNSGLIRTPLSVILLTLLLNTLLRLRIFRSHLEEYRVVACHRNCGSLNKASFSRSPKYLAFPVVPVLLHFQADQEETRQLVPSSQQRMFFKFPEAHCY